MRRTPRAPLRHSAHDKGRRFLGAVGLSFCGLASHHATMRATATEVVAAFQQFSAAGLVAGATDRHLVTQAQRHLAEGAA